MAQQTNLNVSPYFDDFDADSNYHKVLFKPGYPIQARELTGLQSILHNQIEKFGSHFFKEGAKVIPGNTAYTQNFHVVELNNTHLGFPVEYYAEQLLERKIVGMTSGVTALVSKILESSSSDHGNLSLYISYISSGNVEGNEVKVFQDGELLTADTDIISGPLDNPFIPSGESFASCITNNAAAKGAAFSISNGVYFVRGTFVNVLDETIVLSQYDNEPSCRVGLKINEHIVNSDEDETLNDNSKGFNNYAAPGADRLRIHCSLYSKPLDDVNDANFVELAVVERGVLKSKVKHTTYNVIADELARRTYDESGDYVIKPFVVTPNESLNNGMGNNGVYEKGQTSYEGSIAGEDLAQYSVSPGKGFVRGYEVETISTTYLDCPKPRTTKTLEDQGLTFTTGQQLKVNGIYGMPAIGIGNTYIVSLRDRRIGSVRRTVDGGEIGVARVYDMSLEGGSYNPDYLLANEWNLSLYDIQTFTKVTLNEPTTLHVPTFVRGKYSGASAFLASTCSNSSSLVLYEKTGSFSQNEPFIFNGIEDSRVATAITAYGLQNVKAIYGGPELGNVGFARTFNADVMQQEEFEIGEAKVGPRDKASGICTITSTNPDFPGEGDLVKVDDLVSFSGPTVNSTIGAGNTVSVARVTGVSTDYINVVGIQTVPGVIEGNTPQVGVATLTVPDLNILSSLVGGQEGHTLYTRMPRELIADVDLTASSIIIRKSFNVKISAAQNELSATVNAGQNENFQPYDEENYILIRNDGNYEMLSDDKFYFGSGNTTLQISNIGTDLSNDEDATLIATLVKGSPTAKIKRKNKVNTVVINKSKTAGAGTGTTSLNDGLSYGNFPYGTRVQDETISLLHADIIEIHGIFESKDTNEPSAPKATFASITGPAGKTSDLAVGEKFTGQESGAIAMYAEKVNDTQLTYIPLNSATFSEGEVVDFEESQVEAIITTIDEVSSDISSNFSFNSGQKGTFYDYGSIKRKKESRQPTKQLKIYFSNGYYDNSDDGDLTTKNSYNSMHYANDIQSINGVRNTDIIDIRPKVSDYTVSEGARSPLEFYGRTFDGSGNSAANILKSDEQVIIDFSFYLGRIDRIFMTKEGRFQIQYGEPSEKKTEPVIIDDAIEIATVNLAPYMLDVEQDTAIQFMEHKRYRMKDIKKLEDRIKNLEYYSNLSLLETSTQNMFIPDAAGLNKFKSGFFVDNFTSFQPQEDQIPIKNSLDMQQKELRPQHYTNSIDLEMGPVEGVSATEDKSFIQPEGSNVKRSGDVVTLDFTEVEWLKQGMATRSESITPFLISFWQATVELTPASDTWVDTARVKAKVIQVEGNYAQTLAQNPEVDPQTGLAPIVWNAWETMWTGQEIQTSTRTRTERGATTRSDHRRIGRNLRIVNGRIQPRIRVGRRGRRFTWGKRFGFNRGRVNRRIRRNRGRVNPGWLGIHGMPEWPVSRWERVAMAGGIEERQGRGNRSLQRIFLENTTHKTIQDTYRNVIDTGTKTRTGSRKVITEQFDMESQGDKVINREVVPTMRSRNINFAAKKCKPLTRFYGFFDGRNVTRYCTPKLLEISMTSGVFQVGETVWGNSPDGSVSLNFRVCQQNHKEGPFNAPTTVFTNNPYTSQTAATSLESFLGTPGITQLQGGATSNAIPSSYSSTSTILNVDCLGLSAQAQGDWHGFAQTGMILVGRTSGAIATITNVRLISDLGATLIGSFFIPNPNWSHTPQFDTGTKTFTLIDNSTNDKDNSETWGEESYTASGTLETIQEQILSIRNARVEHKAESQSLAVRRETGPKLTSSRVVSTNTTSKAVREWYDPLAQSYQVLDETGVFLTSCDVFFQTKDDMDVPMTFQLRTMKGGVPTQKILPFSEVIIPPSDIKTSQNGTVPTRVTFKAPIFMEPGMDYAITLASWSTKYRVFISRVGEADLVTDEFISQQPYLGSLFKSQNASTWDASQWEDLKFTLYRADFETEGTLEVYNPILAEGNKQIPILPPNPINFTSRKIRVGLSKTLSEVTVNTFEFGNTVYQAGTEATGNYIANAGVATGTMSVINAGFGYTPASGTHVMVGVALTNINSDGKDATAVVTVTNGTVVSAAVSTSGYGYKVGDILGITTSLGINAQLSLVSIAATNEILLDNVQGDFATGVGKTMMFTNSVGIGTTMNGTGGNVLASNIEIIKDWDIGYHDGQHIVVDHKNHGMYHETNYVTISDAGSDLMPTKLSSPYSSNSTGNISIDDIGTFGTFENVSVAATNPGYAKIGNEIVKYTGTSGNTLTGITRKQESTDAVNHLRGVTVEKYELGGISLRRINTTHYLGDIDDAVIEAGSLTPIGYDHYTIKLDLTSKTGIARTTSESYPILYANDTKSAGGLKVKATQNMPFEIVSPHVHNITVPGTSVSATLRTVSGSSVGRGAGDGADIPFADQGFESITLNKTNYLDTSRLIASRINETSSGIIQNFSGDRSFNLRLKLESNDSRLSPIIDTQRMNAILTSNRIDAPIIDYVWDKRVNSMFDDPSACVYVSKENVLQNGATSIKLMMSAHINVYSEIRAFYAISDTPNFEPVFTPFPGYGNINTKGEVLLPELNNGEPDIYAAPSDVGGFESSDLAFKELTFTAENLPKFNSYRIKFVLASVNQVYCPRITELRAITLA